MKSLDEQLMELAERDSRYGRVEEYLRQLMVVAPTTDDRDLLEEVAAFVATMRAGLHRGRKCIEAFASDEWQRGTKCSFCLRLDSECGPLLTGANVSICVTCAQNATESLRALQQ